MKPYPQKPFLKWSMQGMQPYNRPFPLLFDETLTQLQKMNLLMKLFELLQENFISMQEYMDAVTQFIEAEYDKNEEIFTDLKANVESYSERIDNANTNADTALDTSEQALTIAENLDELIKLAYDRINEIIAETGNTNGEVVAARFNAETVVEYPTLFDRLDKEYAQQQRDITDRLTIEAFNEFAQHVINWQPSQVEPSYADIVSKYPDGTTGIVLATDNGHAFIYLNGSWVDLGAYRGNALETDSVQAQHIKASNVAPYHTTFMSQTDRNLFNGDYTDAVLWYHNDPENLYLRRNFNGSRGNVAIVRVNPNTEYSIQLHDASDRLRIALSDTYPIASNFTDIVPTENEQPLSTFVFFGDNQKQHTFTTTATTMYAVIFTSTSNQQPRMQINTGKDATIYHEPMELNKNMLPKTNSANAFNPSQVIIGKAISAIGTVISDGETEPIMYMAYVKPNTTYHVRMFTAGNRLRVASSATRKTTVNEGEQLTLLAMADGLAYVSLTTDANAKTLFIYVSNKNERPLLNITEADNESYVLPSHVDSVTGQAVELALTHQQQLDIDVKKLENDVQLTPGLNQFNDSYYVNNRAMAIDGLIFADDTAADAVCYVCAITPNTLYHIKKLTPSNRLRIGTSDVYTPQQIAYLSSRMFMDMLNTNDALEDFSFTSSNDAKSLVIYVSNQKERPLLNITNTVDDYDYYLYTQTIDPSLAKSVDHIGEMVSNTSQVVEELAQTIDANVQEVEKLELEIAKQRTFFIVGKPELYTSTNHADPTNKTTADVLALYDSVLPHNAITKTQLGVDGIGNPIFEYVWDKPLPHITNNVDYQPTPIHYDRREKIKILINSGTHGDEKCAAYGLGLFFKDLVENKDDPALKYIRDNVTLKIVPVLNPSGYDVHTRNNHNNVDINRDYVALTQNESKIVTKWVDDNLDAITLIDYHNSARTVSFWQPMTKQLEHELFYSVLNWVTDSWQKFDPTIKDNVGEFVITETTTSLIAYGHKHGLMSLTIEGGRHSSSMNGGYGAGYDAVAVKYGNELLVNTIITLIANANSKLV